MGRNILIVLVIVMSSLMWLEIPSARAQFILSSPQLIRRKEQTVDNFLREIEALDLPVINHNEFLSKKQGVLRAKHARVSPQGRMVSQGNGRDYPETDLDCDTEPTNVLQVDLRRQRIECLNRLRHLDSLSGTNNRNSILNDRNQDQFLKMETKLERLIDYLNAVRVTQAKSQVKRSLKTFMKESN